MPILDTIRSQDLFGFPIALNFNKGGSTHKSVLGGAVSIFIKIIIVTYTVVLVNTLVFNENDELQTIKVQSDPDELGEVRLNEMGFVPFITIENIFKNKYE